MVRLDFQGKHETSMILEAYGKLGFFHYGVKFVGSPLEGKKT